MPRYVFAIAFATFTLNNMVNAQTGLSKDEATADKVGSPVYSLRVIELREGVAADAFETFACVWTAGPV